MIESLQKHLNVKKWSSWADLINIFVRIFCMQNLTPFFEEQRLANGAQIWQILSCKFGKFGCTVLEYIVGENKRQIVRQTLCIRVFSLGEKVW